MATGAGKPLQPTRPSSFSRASSPSFSPSSSSISPSLAPGVRIGANGAAFVSSGIPDLNRILGGGFLVGSVVMVMEDGDAPHHLLLLRNFMSQGIVHGQSVLFAGPTKEPRSFLGTLPDPVVQEEGAKIKHDTSDVQDKDWDILSFIRSLRAMVRSSNAVAIITFPASVLSNSISKRWQHLADTLLSVRAIPDEDKDLAKLLTGYQDMLGFIHVHTVSQFNSQVPVILDASTYSLKLQKRRSLVLERLNQAPVEGSSGMSYATSGSCSSSTGSPLDF